MTDGDETADGPALPDQPDADELEAALDAAGEALDAAETERDLDAVEATLDEIDEEIESADLPEPDDEDESGPEAELTDRLDELRSDLDEQRGPYADDAAETAREAAGTVGDAEWTDDGAEAVESGVAEFLDAVGESIDYEADDPGSDPAALADAVEAAADAVEDAGLDPDDDAETVEALAAAADDLDAAVEDAETYDDLSVREQLAYEGFYEPIGQKQKDFPPEWTAMKQWEQRDDAEMILLLLEKMGDSGFIERHCIDALERMGHPDALDEMLQRADRRDERAVAVLGTIADETALDTILEYVDPDADPALQKTTLQALGQIGSDEATQAVADRLAADEASIRSRAARALGLLGDTRAVTPLSDVLAADDDDAVRGSAAWALVQIGTRDALEAAAEYADDDSYVVEQEAGVAAEALDESTAPTA